MLIDVLVHFVSWSTNYDVLSLGIVHFQFHALHPAADITDAPFHRLIITTHRIRVETTVYLMVISVGMPQFSVLINDIENGARVLREFNRIQQSTRCRNRKKAPKTPTTQTGHYQGDLESRTG